MNNLNISIMEERIKENPYWKDFLFDDEREFLLNAINCLSFRFGVYQTHDASDDEYSQQAPYVSDIICSCNALDVAITLACGYLESKDNWTEYDLTIVDHFGGNKFVWNSDEWKAERTPMPLFHNVTDIRRIGLTKTERYFLEQQPWEVVRHIVHQPNGEVKLKSWLRDYIEEHDKVVVKVPS